MVISTKLKQRFCKDYNIPIKLYKEPYFTDRLKLFDTQFNTLEKWDIFVKEVSQFSSEQEYFQYYNQVKDNFINHIKSKPEYKEFITCDMNKFSVPNYQVGRKSIFKENNNNNNKRLISIDLRTANYYAMRYFNKNLVDNTNTYNELIRKFTNLKHIQESKYIRQVVFGNMNPKRQVTIEKYLMNFVMDILLKYMDIKYIQTYMGDEIIFEHHNGIKLTSLYQDLDRLQFEKGFNLHYEDYVLKKIPNTDFYVKYLSDGSIDFKCVDHLFYPFVIRAYKNESIKESDTIFFHEGYLSKFIEVPKIEVV